MSTPADSPQDPTESDLTAQLVERLEKDALATRQAAEELRDENAALKTALKEALAAPAPTPAADAPAAPVAAERRFNEFTGRVEHFTASGELIQ